MKTDYTKEWKEYEQGIEYKQRINLFARVNENYNYVQGKQWDGVDSNGLPTPVFNIIKPVINYKIAQIMQYKTDILYTSMNTADTQYPLLEEIANKLTDYSNQLKEYLKIDYLDYKLMRDAAITGNGAMYFYYDKARGEVACEQIDITNIFPSNPNNPDIQEQRYIIISYRRPVEEVKEEAKANGIKDHELDAIVGDSDNQYEAGDKSRIEIEDDSGQCIVLTKFWKDKKTGTIHFKKSVKSLEIVSDSDTGLSLYPIALMTWEPQKNCFFGVSDVENLIPNQDYINTIAAMIMASTSFTAFPKMVYDATLTGGQAPDTSIGTAIAIDGVDTSIKNVIDYINPGNISNDAFKMFEQTISLTKDLMGANDGALGIINPEHASGVAISAIIEQSAVPLENIKNRYYEYVESVAKIWADFWSAYTTDEGKKIDIKDEQGNTQVWSIDKQAFERMMLSTRIEVGPATRWTQIELRQTLDNLLMNQLIPFEWYVDIYPEGTGFPKKEIQKKIAEQKEQQMMAEQQAIMEQQMAMQNQQAIMAEQQAEKDIVDAIPPELQAEYINNPQMLEQLLSGGMADEPKTGLL